MSALNEVYAEVRVSGEVSAEDVVAARRAIYGSGADVEPSEIEVLLKIEEAADRADPSWALLLCEATVDHFIHEADPVDTIDTLKAGWLAAHLAAEGKIKTLRELELLVRVMEESRSAPDTLVALALSQVRAAVRDGEGPLARADVECSRITHDQAMLARRVLHAFGGREGVPVTRAVAEIVFDINDAASGADNDPEWTGLFVAAIATFVMSASVSPPRAVLPEEDNTDEAPGADSFTEFAVNRLRGILDSYLTPRFVGRTDADGGIGKGNAQWLAERIGRDGHLDDNEKALLRHLRDETPAIHPALKELIARAA